MRALNKFLGVVCLLVSGVFQWLFLHEAEALLAGRGSPILMLVYVGQGCGFLLGAAYLIKRGAVPATGRGKDGSCAGVRQLSGRE